MPITTRINTAKNLTTFTVTGILSFAEVMPAVEAFYTCKPTRYVLWDLHEIICTQLASKQVEGIASFQSRNEGKRKSGKTAIVAREDFLYGLSRMLEIQNGLKESPYTIMVFRSVDEAHKWLDEP